MATGILRYILLGGIAALALAAPTAAVAANPQIIGRAGFWTAFIGTPPGGTQSCGLMVRAVDERE
jgi:hypothetical protein